MQCSGNNLLAFVRLEVCFTSCDKLSISSSADEKLADCMRNQMLSMVGSHFERGWGSLCLCML